MTCGIKNENALTPVRMRALLDLPDVPERKRAAIVPRGIKISTRRLLVIYAARLRVWLRPPLTGG